MLPLKVESLTLGLRLQDSGLGTATCAASPVMLAGRVRLKVMFKVAPLSATAARASVSFEYTMYTFILEEC